LIDNHLCTFDTKIDFVFCYRVEHLHEIDLSRLPEAIFGHISPQLVIMTTPNAEFNVLFPNPTALRHPDHKFEWTRPQFADW